MKTFGLPRFARGRCQGEPLSPSGNVRIGDLMPMVPVNSVVGDFKDLNNIPSARGGRRRSSYAFSDRSSTVPTFRPVTRSWMVIAPYTSPLSSYGCALHRPHVASCGGKADVFNPGRLG